MDIESLAIGKKYTNQVALGIASMSVSGTTVTFVTTGGVTAKVTLPTPADGKGISGVRIDENSHLICTMTDGTEIDGGLIGSALKDDLECNVTLGGVKSGDKFLAGTLGEIPSWTGTSAEFEALDKSTLVDGTYINITDDESQIIDDTNVTTHSVYSSYKVEQRLKESDTYSSEETVIGKWIDGKPIYRKVFEIDNNSATQDNLSFDISSTNYFDKIWLNGNSFIKIKTDIDSVIVSMPLNFISGNTTSAYFVRTNIQTYSDDRNKIRVYIESSEKKYVTGHIYLILEYTKTTD